MGNVISNLKARFGVDTSDFKKGLKDGEKATSDFKDAAGSTLDEFASMFGVNMSGVSDAMDTAGKSLKFLGQSFVGAAKGGDILAISMKVLKFALIATGIGAIVVGLGSLIAYFTKSGQGADQFAKILMQVRSVVNNVIERFVVFGKGLVEFATGKFAKGIETMGGAFKGMGNEIREDVKAAGALADAEDALEDKEIELITVIEERKRKIEELRLAAKDLDLTEQERLKKLNEAEKLIKANAQDQIGIEQERLRIMREKINLQTSDPTDEQRKEVKVQEGLILEIMAGQLSETRALTREKNTLLKVVAAELALEKAKKDQVAIFKADISNLKIPDLAKPMIDALAPLQKVKESITEVNKAIGEAFNDALGSAAAGFGEFLGALAIGDASVKDFGKVMAASFADLAITIGKLAISSAITIGALDKILKTPGAWPVALAAGIALVAVGSAIKGSLSNAASGGGSSGGSSGYTGSGAGSYTYDTRGSVKIPEFPKQIELVASGGTLRGVLNFEDNRKYIST